MPEGLEKKIVYGLKILGFIPKVEEACTFFILFLINGKIIYINLSKL